MQALLCANNSEALCCAFTGLKGEARLRILQRWCTLLRELQPSNLPLLHCYTLNALSPGSPQLSSSDSDWQQLQFSGPEGTAPTPGAAGASPKAAKISTAHRGASLDASVLSSGAHAGPAAKGPELDFWANQVLYLDQESTGKEKELLTFREMFLQSYALENIIVGESNYSLPRPGPAYLTLGWGLSFLYCRLCVLTRTMSIQEQS